MHLPLLPDDRLSLGEQRALQRPLDRLEHQVVALHLASPQLLSARETAHLRWGIALARMDRVHYRGEPLSLGPLLGAFREDVLRQVSTTLKGANPTRGALTSLLGHLPGATQRAWSALTARTRSWLPTEVLEQEVRQKALVLALGGGGGTAFVYVGVLAQLEAEGIRPSLLVGTSMGAILALFRARRVGFDQAEAIHFVRGLSWRRLFRALSTQSRYGLPGALRLSLRAGFGHTFEVPGAGRQVRLKELAIPTLMIVGGVRRGRLPRPPEAYAAEGRLRTSHPHLLRRMLGATGPITELVTQPETLKRLVLGEDDLSAGLEAADAAGFSSALPGVIHYDVTRDDPRSHSILGALLEQHGVSRLVDGGLVDNLPVEVASRAVQRGAVGTRNALVLGLNGFAPRLSTPLWYPLQQIAELTVRPQRDAAHLICDFHRTLSPLDVVPGVEQLVHAMDLGVRQFEPLLPMVRELLRPLPSRAQLWPGELAA